jgi:hypothetical protein
MKKLALCGLLSVSFLVLSSLAVAADFDKFKTLAQQTMTKVSAGSVSDSDIDELIKMQKEMIEIGKKACDQYAASNPDSAKMLKIVSSNADKMPKLTLSEIEEQWHEKGVLKSSGIEAAQLEEKSVTGSLMDTVVHPATAIIALKEYKTSKDKALLQQVNDELEEVLHHVDKIKM